MPEMPDTLTADEAEALLSGPAAPPETLTSEQADSLVSPIVAPDIPQMQRAKPRWATVSDAWNKIRQTGPVESLLGPTAAEKAVNPPLDAASVLSKSGMVAAAGVPLASMGRTIVASAADVGAAAGGDNSFKNLAVASKPGANEPLPYEEELAQKHGLVAGLQSGAVGLAKMIPLLAGGEAAIAAKIPSVVAFPAIFGSSTYAETGDPAAAAVSAGLGVAFPVVDRAAANFSKNLTSKWLLEGKINNRQAVAAEAALKLASMQATMQAFAIPDYISNPQDWEKTFAANGVQGLAFSANDVLKTFNPQAASMGQQQNDALRKKFVNDVSSGLRDVISGKYDFKPTKEVPNASEIPSPTGVSQPEVRTPVGENAPLRQSGQAPDARPQIPQPRVAPVVYRGYQAGYQDIPGFHLYNLTADIPGTSFVKDSTVSRASLEQAGFAIPPEEAAKETVPAPKPSEPSKPAPIAFTPAPAAPSTAPAAGAASKPNYQYTSPESKAWWEKKDQLESAVKAATPMTPEFAAARKARIEHEDLAFTQEGRKAGLANRRIDLNEPLHLVNATASQYDMIGQDNLTSWRFDGDWKDAEEAHFGKFRKVVSPDGKRSLVVWKNSLHPLEEKALEANSAPKTTISQPEVEPKNVPGAVPSSEAVPAQSLFIQIGDQTYPVKSLADASAKFSEARTRVFNQGMGSEALPSGPLVVDGNGRAVGRVSQNGNIWDAMNPKELIHNATGLVKDAQGKWGLPPRTPEPSAPSLSASELSFGESLAKKYGAPVSPISTKTDSWDALMRYSNMLHRAADASRDESELTKILDAAKGKPEESRIAWSVVSNPHSSSETYAKAKANEALRAMTTDENIASMDVRRAELRKQRGLDVSKPTSVAPVVPAVSRTPAETLNSASSVKVTLPKGATMLRIYTTLKGKKFAPVVVPKSDFDKGNVFKGAGVTKVEAGTIAGSGMAKGKFKTVPGDVVIEDRNAPVPAAPKPILPSAPQARQPLYKVGDTVYVSLKKGSEKLHTAIINQLQPDGSAKVYLKKAQTYADVAADQIVLTTRARNKLANEEEMKGLTEKEKKQVGRDDLAFKRIIKDEGPRFGWFAGEHLDENNLKSQGIEANDALISGIEFAFKDAKIEGNPESIVDRAKGLEKLKKFVALEVGSQEQKANFANLTAEEPGKIEVRPEEDYVAGQTVVIDDQDFKVIRKDEATGDVWLEDGRRFGTQKIKGGESIWIDKADNALPDEAVTFLEEEKARKDTIPKLRPGEKVGALTKAEQSEFEELSRIARAAREAGGVPLTTEQARRYQELEAKVGQGDLIAESTGANEAAELGEIARLRRKADEIDRQVRLLHDQANASNVRDRRAMLRKQAYDAEKEAIAIRADADEREYKLRGKDATKGNLTLQSEGQVEKPAETVKPPELDLFAAPDTTKLDAIKAKRKDIQDRLRKKFGQTNMVVDPEVATIATELAVNYAQEGVVRFSDFARRVKADLPELWEKLKSYLHGAWTSASQFHPELDEVNRKQAADALAELDTSVNPPKPPADINPKPVKVEDIGPLKATASDKAIINFGSRAQVDALAPEIKLVMSSAKNHFTLWLLDARRKGRPRWEYLTILGKDKDEAIARARAVADKLAVGDTTGIAFFGKGKWEQPKTIGIYDTPASSEELMAIDRDLTPVGEQTITFGKMQGTKVKDVWEKDPGWAMWAAENLKGRSAAIGNYLRERPEYRSQSDAKVAAIEAQKGAAIDAVTPETLAILAKFKLNADVSNDGFVRIGGETKGATYEWKETIKAIPGRRWNDGLQKWEVPPAGFSEFVRKLAGLPAGDSGRQGTGIPKYLRDERLGTFRKNAESRPDQSGFTDPISTYVGDDTAALISRGLSIGMPKFVVDEQIEDVARINRAYKFGKNLFILASEPGSGKTFVLGGAIRELIKSGAKTIYYVTLRDELITQIRQDLAAFGIDSVKFITYPKMRELKPEESDVIIYDESHSIKNVKDAEAGGAKQAKKAADWIAKSKFTILSSATPFENPVQTVYLETTGIFNEAFGDAKTFAEAYGASSRTFKVQTRNGPVEMTELVWKRTTTSDTDSRMVREFFRKEGVFTSRKIRLPAGAADSRMVSITVPDAAAKIYRGFDEAAEELEDDLGSNAIMWVTNFKKRLLEASKVQTGIKEAEDAMRRGRWPILFVETKAERKFDIPSLLEREAEYQQAKGMALQNKDAPPLRADWGLPPEGIPEVLGRFMEKTGLKTIEIPSAMDLIVKHFGEENVAIFTGDVSPAQAQKNLDRWRAAKKPMVILATMAKGGTGLSLHDKIGNHQTTQININLPWTASQVVQVAQRSARYGIKGQAEMVWLFADNIPFDRFLSSRVGGRMADMGSIVHGAKLEGAENIEDFNFEDRPFSEINTEVRGGDQKPPQASLGDRHAPATARPAVEAQTPEQLRAALPTSGLNAEQQNLIRAFLDSPMSRALEGVRVRIADTLRGGWAGSYFDGMVELARTADPKTGPHEFAHRIWELLPDEVHQQFEAMRVAEINRMLKTAQPYQHVIHLEQLRKNPTSGGEQFTSRGYARELYHLSSAEEFFTHSLSDRFVDRLDAKQRGVWEQAKALFQSILAAVKKFAGLDQSKTQLLDNIIAGRYELTPEGETATRTRQAAGYADDFSKSNNALNAEASGKFPASEIARRLGVPTAFIKENAPKSGEWHHTSKFYNATDYYDLQQVKDWLDGVGDYAPQGNEPIGNDQLVEWKMKQKALKESGSQIARGLSIKYLEWGGTRNHPVAHEILEHNVTIEQKPGQKMVTITKQDGTSFRKGLETRGFEIQGDDGKWFYADYNFKKAVEKQTAELNAPNRTAQASLPKEEDSGDVTQIMGADVPIGSRPHNTADSTAASVNHAKAVFDKAKIPVEAVVIPDNRRIGADGKPLQITLWKMDTSFDLNSEVRNGLLPLLADTLKAHTQGTIPADQFANLIRSIQWNIETGNLSKLVDGKPVLDLDLRLQLLNDTTSFTSEWGRVGAALAAHSVPLQEVMADPQLHLHRQYYEMFGGKAIESLVQKIVSHFRGFFTDDELKGIEDNFPRQKAVIDEAIALNREDNVGRVYRRVQALLKPKSARKLSAMEADTKVQEAVKDILAQAAKQGIEPTERPGKKSMTPLEQLLHLVDESNADKVDALIASAVKQAEHNAGVAFALKKASANGAEAVADLQGRFEAGEEPNQEEIDNGLELHQFSHWKPIRDNLLDYSPVTVKLVESVLRGDFKGVKFGAAKVKPVEPKIDLRALARQPEAEVQRVLDGYYKDISDNIDLHNATEETKQRIVKMMQDKVAQQIQALRTEFLKNFFEPKQMVQRTASQKLAQLINAGVAKDPRFQSDKVRQLVKRVAGQYLTGTDFESLATSTRAEKFNWIDRKYDDIFRAERFDLLDQPTRDYFEAVVRTQLAERLQAAEEKITRAFLRGPDANFDSTPMTDERRAASLNAAKSKVEGLARSGAFDAAMVNSVSGKSAIQKLMPRVSDLIKEVLNNPVQNRVAIRKAFVSRLVDDLNIDPALADKVGMAFDEAYGLRIDAAKKQALDQAVKNLTPDQKAVVFGEFKNRGIWSKIEHLANAGGLDTNAVLEAIAQKRGFKLLSPDDAAKIKGWVSEIHKLRELTPKQREMVGDNPEDLAKAQLDREAETLERRLALKKQIETMWSRLTLPLGLKHYANWGNTVAGGGELASASLLLKLGFPPRQFIDIVTQATIQNPTRALQAAWSRVMVNVADGNKAEVAAEISAALSDSFNTQLKATKSALIAFKATLIGTSQARNVDNLISKIALFERAAQVAAEYAAKGDHVRAMLLNLFTHVRWGRQIASALDQLQGTPVEAQEMQQRVITWLRENGRTRAQAIMEAQDIIRDIPTELELAIATAKQLADAEGYNPTPNELRMNGVNIAKARAYARIREAGLPADDFQSEIYNLREVTSWNVAEKSGIGSLVAAPIRKLSEFGESFPPAAIFSLAFGRFANAIAISANRAAMFTPLGYFPDAFGVHLEGAKKNVTDTGIATGGSAWLRTPEDRLQRKVEATIGMTLGGFAIALVASGLVSVQWKSPQDKRERDLWLKAGHKPGTVEFNLPDGSFIPLSLTVGPMRPIAPYLVGAGSVMKIADQRAKAQAAMDAEADRKGVPRGKIKPIGLEDYLYVAGQTAWSTLIGGRTAQGLVGAVTDYGVPNPQKALSAAIAPLLPPLPAYQELSRMMGVTLDPKAATVFDFLVPLPSSAARSRNVLGDPVGTNNDLQRTIQIMTGGTYPIPVDPQDAANSSAAYGVLFATGYRPPAILPNHGYNIGGIMRPMTDPELERYTELRGQYLKAGLAALGTAATKQQAQAVYREANARALSDVGVQQTTLATTARASTGPSRKTSSRGRMTSLYRRPVRQRYAKIGRISHRMSSLRRRKSSLYASFRSRRRIG